MRELSDVRAEVTEWQTFSRRIDDSLELSQLGDDSMRPELETEVTAIVAESGLSFLGFGVEPPAPTWGWTLAYGMRYLRSHMWLSTAPGLAILVTVLGFNLFGDGLRDRLDPRGLVRSSPPS